MSNKMFRYYDGLTDFDEWLSINKAWHAQFGNTEKIINLRDIGGDYLDEFMVLTEPTDRLCTAHEAVTPINYDHPELQPRHCIKWHEDRPDAGYECQWIDVVRVPKEDSNGHD